MARTGLAIIGLAIALVTPVLAQTPPPAILDQTPLNTPLKQAISAIKAGSALNDQGKYAEAIIQYKIALGLTRRLGDRQGEGLVLNNLGEAERLLGQPQNALANFRQAIPLLKAAGDNKTAAISLNNLGLVYDSLGQHDKALDSYKEGYQLLGPEPQAIAGQILINASDAYQQLGQPQEAIEALKKSVEISQKVNDRPQIGLGLYQMSLIYQANLGESKLALDASQQSLTMAREIKDDRLIALNLNELGQIHQSLGQYDKALEYYQQALPAIKTLGDREGEGQLLNNFGELSRVKGDYSKAIGFYNQALAIAKATQNRPGEAVALNNLGITYLFTSNYSQALSHSQEALTLTRTHKLPSIESITLNNFGEIYRNLGQFEKAVEQYRQSLDVAKRVGDRTNIGGTLNNLGLILLTAKQYQEAIDVFNQATPILEGNGNQAALIRIYNNLGQSYQGLNQPDKALAVYQKGLALIRKLNSPVAEGTLLNNLGLLSAEQNQPDLALDYYRQALALSRQTSDRYNEAITLTNQANSLRKQGKLAPAEQSLLAAITIWESLRTGLSSDNKVSFQETFLGTYRLLQEVLVEQNRTDDALNVAERGKARVLVELLARQGSNIVAIKSPDLAQIRTIAKTQNATLVEYSITKEKLYIWVIKPNGEINFKSVDRTADDLSDLTFTSLQEIGVRSARAKISIVTSTTTPSSIPSSIPSSTTTTNASLTKLHQLLIEPIQGDLPLDPNQNVIFLPQGELFLLPFSAFQDKQGKYLIERHTLSIAPSIQSLQFSPKSSQPLLSRPLIIGDPKMPTWPNITLSPLPGARTEAIAIANLLTSTPLIGDQATETTVVQQMPRASLLHFATHGLLDAVQGETPGAIALTSSGNDSASDGFLNSSEILTLKLSADLAVLSACDTGRGTITGDGVLGLSRAFAVAGVPTVVVSLWQVPDKATEKLMTQFYTQLKSGKPKAQALRESMLTTIKQYPDPLFWAAFTLVGNPD